MVSLHDEVAFNARPERAEILREDIAHARRADICISELGGQLVVHGKHELQKRFYSLRYCSSSLAGAFIVCLGFASLDDDMATWLSTLYTSTCIEDLDVSYNNITGVGVEHG